MADPSPSATDSPTADRRASGRRPAREEVHGSHDAEQLAEMATRPTRTVDAMGTFCPEPLIRTQEAAREGKEGDVLLLVADDAAVEIDLPAWCMSTGNQYLGALREPDRILVLVRLR